jgi:hypothetical protein
MKTALKFFSLSIFLFCLSGCASIVTKTTYPVTINSTPSEAKIVITDKKGYDIFQGTTPTVVPLKSSAGFFSKAEYYLKISLPGYDDYLTTISADIDGWYFGNILFGGLIGWIIVDPATGAMWKIDVQQINAQLRPSRQALQIYDIKDIPEDWHQYLVKIN